MFIEQITLQNIKSYGSNPTTIQFKEGINLITGTNGAGKSTILEAIGFVLFDTLPYNQSDFVHQGKSGSTKITIRLHSAYDNRVYDIERAIPARYKVIDVQDKIEENIKSKDDLLEWLCQHLKVDNKDDLTLLFENAVGVQQGTITAVFLANAGGRKTTFDSLLRVQDFEQAWSALGKTKKYIEELLNQNTNEISRKEGQTEQLPELENIVETDRNDIEVKEKKLESLEKELEELKSNLEQLAQQEQKLDALNRQIEQADANIEHLQKNLTAAQDDHNQSQKASEIVSENEEAYRLHIEATEHSKDLEVQRKKRDELVEVQQKAEKKIDIIQQQIEQLNRSLAEIEAAEAELIELKPLVDRQDQLEKEQTHALDEQKERDRIQGQVMEDKQKLDLLETELKELHEGTSKRQELNEQVEQFRQQEEALKVQINELSTERSTLDQQLEAVQQVFDEIEKQFLEYERLQENIKHQEEVLEKAEAKRQQISSDLVTRTKLDIRINNLDVQITQETADKTTSDNSCSSITNELEELQQMRKILGEKGATCPVCRREMDGQAHLEATEYYDLQQQRLNDKLQEAKDTIARLQLSIGKCQEEKEGIEKKLDALANQAALTIIEREIAELKTGVSELQSSLAILEDVPQKRAGAEADINNAHDDLNQCNTRINKLTVKQTTLIQEIGDLNQEIADLPSQDELKRREDEHNTLSAKIALSDTRLEELADIDDKVQQLKDNIASLDNPREKQAIARNTADKRETLETEYHDAEDNLGSIQLELEDTQQNLQIYQTLDDNLEANRQLYCPPLSRPRNGESKLVFHTMIACCAYTSAGV